MNNKFFKIAISVAMLILPIYSLSAKTFSEKYSGRIILQVESKGEAWYVSPVNQKRYFLGKPNDAFRIIRSLGLGISNANFSKFEKNLPEKYLGKIFLKTEDKGKAYYANPLDKKFYFLGRPTDAFNLMRKLGLGMKNGDLIKITEDKSSVTERNKQNSQTIVIEVSKSENAINPIVTPSEAATNTPEIQPIASSSVVEASSTISQTSTSTLSEKCEFLAEYFKNETATGASVFQEKEYGLNHVWGTGTPAILGNFTDRFSAKYTANCFFEAGKYEFITTYDDGVKATIDGFWLANSWRNNNSEKVTSTILDISEGMHNILVRYYEHLGNATIKLDWKKL